MLGLQPHPEFTPPGWLFHGLFRSLPLTFCSVPFLLNVQKEDVSSSRILIKFRGEQTFPRLSHSRTSPSLARQPFCLPLHVSPSSVPELPSPQSCPGQYALSPFLHALASPENSPLPTVGTQSSQRATDSLFFEAICDSSDFHCPPLKSSSYICS